MAVPFAKFFVYLNTFQEKFEVLHQTVMWPLGWPWEHSDTESLLFEGANRAPCRLDSDASFCYLAHQRPPPLHCALILSILSFLPVDSNPGNSSSEGWLGN